MRITEILLESLDAPYQFAWAQKDASGWYGKFLAADNSEIIFSASQPSDYGWEISWTRDLSSTRIKTDPRVAREILATVNAMINEFVTTVRPENIYVALTSPDQTKMNIYTRILDKLGYTGYLEDDEDVLEEHNLTPEYTWYIFN